MSYGERATEGNQAGIAEVQKELDPLRQKIFLMPESMARDLKLKAINDGVSESEIVRGLLKQVL